MGRLQRRHAFVAVALATLAGCLSFDALTGGGSESSDDASIGATTTDATSTSDAPTDASIDSGPAFDCAAFPDASLCDDFNRDAAIPFSDLRWQKIDCLAADTLTVGGTLTTSAPPTSNSHCELISKSITNTGHFTLDFDLTFNTTDAAASGNVVVASVNFSLPKANEAGVQVATFQLLISAGGLGQWQLLDYYPVADASPTGGSYVGYNLVTTAPFVEEGTRCHIHLVGDDSGLNPSGGATSTCDGANPVTLVAAPKGSGRGLSGPGQLTLGYVNNSQSTAPTWTVDYDNVVYAAQ
jgi:hypothetical protein